jgi:TIR domain
VARGERLFSTHDLRAVLEAHVRKAQSAVAALPAADVAPERENETLDHLEGEYRIAPLELLEDQASVEHEEAQVDVSHDPMRFITDRSRPFLLPGQRVKYFVPFRGDRELWKCRPSSFSLQIPGASEVLEAEIVFEFTVVGAEIVQTKAEYASALSNVRQWIGFMRSELDTFNNQLRGALKPQLEKRRALLAQATAELGALGLPVRAKAVPAAAAAAPASAEPATPKRGRRPTAAAAAPASAPVPDYDVALSFAGEDREYLERVATLLMEAGVRVFYDRFETAKLWGSNLADHLAEVYGKRSRFVVLFISKHYPLKAWPTHERQNAQARAIREQKVVLLPARFDDTEVPGLPSTTGFVDLRELPPEGLVTLILEKLRGRER